MKNSLLVILFTSFIFSCSSNTNRNAASNANLNNQSSLQAEDDIPSGYTRLSPHEYVPNNTMEENLFNYLHEYAAALKSRNAEKIIELYYPDYFVLLQKEIPNKSVNEIKEKMQLYYEQNFDTIIGEYTNAWPKAKYADSRVTKIINRVKEGDKLLYLYEYHTMLFNETDTIYKKAEEYSVAVSLDNGKAEERR